MDDTSEMKDDPVLDDLQLISEGLSAIMSLLDDVSLPHLKHKCQEIKSEINLKVLELIPDDIVTE